jgi:hypothetical protein
MTDNQSNDDNKTQDELDLEYDMAAMANFRLDPKANGTGKTLQQAIYADHEKFGAEGDMISCYVSKQNAMLTSCALVHNNAMVSPKGALLGYDIVQTKVDRANFSNAVCYSLVIAPNALPSSEAVEYCKQATNVWPPNAPGKKTGGIDVIIAFMGHHPPEIEVVDVQQFSRFSKLVDFRSAGAHRDIAAVSAATGFDQRPFLMLTEIAGHNNVLHVPLEDQKPQVLDPILTYGFAAVTGVIKRGSKVVQEPARFKKDAFCAVSLANISLAKDMLQYKGVLIHSPLALVGHGGIRGILRKLFERCLCTPLRYYDVKCFVADMKIYFFATFTPKDDLVHGKKFIPVPEITMDNFIYQAMAQAKKFQTLSPTSQTQLLARVAQDCEPITKARLVGTLGAVTGWLKKNTSTGKKKKPNKTARVDMEFDPNAQQDSFFDNQDLEVAANQHAEEALLWPAAPVENSDLAGADGIDQKVADVAMGGEEKTPPPAAVGGENLVQPSGPLIEEVTEPASLPADSLSSILDDNDEDASDSDIGDGHIQDLGAGTDTAESIALARLHQQQVQERADRQLAEEALATKLKEEATAKSLAEEQRARVKKAAEDLHHQAEAKAKAVMKAENLAFKEKNAGRSSEKDAKRERVIKRKNTKQDSRADPPSGRRVMPAQ